jgi:acetaldehyde dehydrogenase (acetylating)
MTLGCGATAGNSTSDNIGPMNLINLKRVAAKVREASEAFESKEGKAYIANPPGLTPPPKPPATATVQLPTGRAPERPAIASAVEKYLASRGVASAKAYPTATADDSLRSVVEGVVDSFLGGATPAIEVPLAPEEVVEDAPAQDVTPVAFVCEDDVRQAKLKGEKIYITKATIVTPSARDRAARDSILVETE